MSASLFKDLNRFPIANLPGGRDDMTGSCVLVTSLVLVAACFITVGKGEADVETMSADEISNSLRTLMSPSSPFSFTARLKSATTWFRFDERRPVAGGFFGGESARERTLGEGKVPSSPVRGE
jgi:hypothetical protein